MERITITLPEQMKAYIDEQVKGGSYGNTSEFIRDLIRTNQKKRDIQELNRLLKEGLDSESLPFNREVLDEIAEEAHRNVQALKLPK